MLGRATCAAVVLAVAGFVPAAASPSASGSTICVGLIIDGHTLGTPVSDTCVKVKPGTTGVGVLQAAGHSVTYRADGLICTIDALPDTGCSKVDNTHYWAYYHRAADHTTWSYSVQDARTYEPPNRSTEGWVYDNGSSLKPENIPAEQMCAGLVKPTSSPTPTPKKTNHAASSTKSPRVAPTSSVTPALTATKDAHSHRSRTAAPRPLKSATTSSVPTASPFAVSRSSSTGSDHGNATGAVVAAGVIAVLAAATVIGARRRRR